MKRLSALVAIACAAAGTISACSGTNATPASVTDASALDSGGEGADGSGAPADAATGDAEAGSPFGATVNGTIGAKPVATTDSYATLFSRPSKQTSKVTNILWVAIVDYPGSCALEQSGAQKARSTRLSIDLEATNVQDPEKPPRIMPGAYPFDVHTTPVPDANGALFDIQIVYDVIDDVCQLPDGNNFASKGTLAITSITSTSIAGTFDVILASNDHVTGRFNSPLCEVHLDAGTEVTCKP